MKRYISHALILIFVAGIIVSIIPAKIISKKNTYIDNVNDNLAYIYEKLEDYFDENHTAEESLDSILIKLFSESSWIEHPSFKKESYANLNDYQKIQTFFDINNHKYFSKIDDNSPIIWDKQGNHPKGRCVLFKSGKILFLESEEFKKINL